jgi:hypothetical protein
VRDVAGMKNPWDSAHLYDAKYLKKMKIMMKIRVNANVTKETGMRNEARVARMSTYYSDYLLFFPFGQGIEKY